MFLKKNVKFFGNFLTVKWQFSGVSVSILEGSGKSGEDWKADCVSSHFSLQSVGKNRKLKEKKVASCSHFKGNKPSNIPHTN